MDIISSFLPAIQGGLLLGLATSINYMLLGRITGMSGLLVSIFRLSNYTYQSMILLSGMLFISALTVSKYVTIQQPFDLVTDKVNSLQYLIAGILVGLGTRLSNGCTSGHGLCGLPRFSLRSLTAVMLFLPVAVMTASLELKKYLPIYELQSNVYQHTHYYVLSLSLFVPIVLVIFGLHKLNLQLIVSFIVGIIFGLGLMVSGMTKRSKIEGFLNITSDHWDASLLFVLFSGVLFNLITFNFSRFVIKDAILNRSTRLYDSNLADPQGKVDLTLVTGAILFGLGWGLGCMCPGPLYMLLTTFQWRIQGVWIIGCILGQQVIQRIQSNKLKKS